MEKEINLSISIKKEAEGGYSVICTDLDVASQGETVDEAVENIKEAVNLYLDTAGELNLMDDVFERLGVTKEYFEEKEFKSPRIFRTEIPVKLAI